ncbi:MAG: RsiV family protein [Candidatus Limnocylindrales bacterium]|jgi:hypothetical protein
MESNFFVRRIKALFPVAALAVVALIAVTTAMTILGDTQSATPIVPSGSTTATPTIAVSGSPSAVPTETPSPVMTVPLPSAMPVIITVYKGEHDPHHIWYVVWRYPQFRSSTTPLASLVNQDILDEVDTRITAFEGGPAAVEQLPGKTNNLTGTFTVDMLSYDLVSLTLRWVDDTSPAHAATNIETLTYALNSGERLDFGQLFTDTPAALAILSAQSREQLRKSLGADYDPTVVEDGTAAVGTNFDNWALTPAGLKIVFAEYQVGTYADGMPVVVIPWSSLKSVMQPDGPAARLAGFPTPT